MRTNHSAYYVVILLAPAVIWAWLAMMLTHELGHVIAAWATGAEIVELQLRPGRLSHTLVRPNPQPSLVLWGGFLMGWLAPQATAIWWRVERGLIGPVLRAWAAFCLLAGGVYLAIGGFEQLTDTGQLVAIGWPLWLLVTVGATVAAVGYWRLRSAWLALRAMFNTRGVTRRAALFWWLFLAGWWGAQHTLAVVLQPQA